jgi:hypothetical protein
MLPQSNRWKEKENVYMREQFLAENSHQYLLSLKKLIGEIEDVYGRVSVEFGDPIFKISLLVLKDGTMLQIDGEHDIAYFYGGKVKNLQEEFLQKLYEEEY